MYKAEVCFLHGLSPWTPVGAVPDLPAVVTGAQRLLGANVERAAQTTTGDTRPGRRMWVYGRGGKPCRRCGTPIRRLDEDNQDGRVTYWCPACQPGPVPG